MNAAEVVKSLIEREPFQPFWVELSNGEQYSFMEAWHWENRGLNSSEVVEINLITPVREFYDYESYERSQREEAARAFFDSQEYQKLLRSPEWKEKSKEIIEERGCCAFCGATEHLQVHHKFYILHTDPWDYPPHAYMVLCRRCHQEWHDK